MRKTRLLIALFPLLLACKTESSAADGGSSATETTKDSGELTFAAPTTNTINFGGYSWVVKAGSGMGPGPNTWSTQNVWVDGKGYMHLKLSFDAATSKWTCAGVTSTQNFGHGTYQWKIQGPISALDKNVVAGFFHYSGPDGFNEMDIEFARWNDDSKPNVNYSVYPAQGSAVKEQHSRGNWTQTGGTASTHRYTWTDASVVFKSMNGFYDDDTNMFQTYTFTPPTTSIPTANMPVKMNLWCFKGLAPSDGQSVEIVIREFKFTPLP